MEVYTEEEREYHSDIIQDAIDFLERRKPSFEIPVEEHIDLILSYHAHMDLLSGTEDILNKEEYIKLYEHSEITVRYLAEVYRKTTTLNLDCYYVFCKTISKMMEIIVRDTGSSEEDLADIFKKMKM